MVGMSHSPFATMLGAARADRTRRPVPVRHRPGCRRGPRARTGRRRGHRPRSFPRELLRRDAAVRARRGGGGGVRGLRQPLRSVAASVRARLADPRPAGRRRIRRRAVLRAYCRPRHRAELRHGVRCATASPPLVPLVVNTAAPPLPPMRRCVALGRSLGAGDQGGRRGPGADHREQQPLALAAVQRPARPRRPRRAAGRDDSRPARRAGGLTARESRVRALGGTRTPGSTPNGTPGSSSSWSPRTSTR